MKICKYCKKPIEDIEVWNPDENGNGYHHKCLIEMEFISRDRRIYDKGKNDALDKVKQIKDEIEQLPTYLEYPNIEYITIKKQDLINIIDKAIKEIDG